LGTVLGPYLQMVHCSTGMRRSALKPQCCAIELHTFTLLEALARVVQ
jgi:hypothetical protein